MPYRKWNINLLDIILVLFIFAAGGYIIHRLSAGLDYKWNWAAIPQYLFRYDPAAKEWVPNLLILGLFTTIRLSIWGTILATIIGTVMGLCRVSGSLFKRLTAKIYVELIRNLPPIVLIFIIYYFFSSQIMTFFDMDRFVQTLPGSLLAILEFMFGSPSLFAPFLSALITLALFEGAYITEIVRAGVQSIEKGQWEASSALGFTRRQQMRHIILPLATRRILPPLAGQFISTIKDSAIVSVISVQELTFQGMELMSTTYLVFEVWITITLLYLILTLALSLSVERLEIYLRRGET